MRHLQRIQGKNHEGSLTTTTVVHPDGTELELTDKLDIENACKKLRHHIATLNRLRYWSAKHKNIQHKDMDLGVFNHASQNVPIWTQHWLSKWHCGMCGVGKWLERWKDHLHSNCPRCLTADESVEHVIRCPHADATS